MKFSLTFVLLLILIIFQFFLIQPFFHQGFFPTHDDIQTVRIFEYYQGLRYGGFPPRWSSGLLYGYGYPLFIFYNPFAYFLGAILIFIGSNFLIATKAVFILGFFIGVTGVFFLLRSFVGSVAAFVASMSYSLIPYRAVEVYVRGDLAEFLAYSLFPWVFWVNFKLIKKPKDILLVCLSAIFLAILILSHNISTFIYIIFLISFDLFYILKYEERNKRLVPVKGISLSIFLALLITCFYWLPLLFESQFVQLSRITNDPINLYFLTFKQIWQSAWGYGGFLQQNPMSLQIGQIIIIVSALTLFFNIVIKTYFRNFIFFICMVFIISIIMETHLSQSIWDQITLLHYLQFPWRLHILNTICGTMLIGFFFYLVQHSKIYHHKLIKIFVVIIGISIIFFSFKESYLFFREKYFFEAKPVAATTTGEEYLPKWVKSLPNTYPPNKITFLKNDGKLENIEWGYYHKKFTSINDKNIQIRIAHIYYPGWKAYINNRPVHISYDNDFAQMEIAVPKGINNIVFTFQKTWWRWVADITSTTGTIGVFFLMFTNIPHRKKVEFRR